MTDPEEIAWLLRSDGEPWPGQACAADGACAPAGLSSSANGTAGQTNHAAPRDPGPTSYRQLLDSLLKEGARS